MNIQQTLFIQTPWHQTVLHIASLQGLLTIVYVTCPTTTSLDWPGLNNCTEFGNDNEDMASSLHHLELTVQSDHNSFYRRYLNAAITSSLSICHLSLYSVVDSFFFVETGSYGKPQYPPFYGFGVDCKDASLTVNNEHKNRLSPSKHSIKNSH